MAFLFLELGYSIDTLMLSLTKITDENGVSDLDMYLKGEEFAPLFFFSSYTLMTWLGHHEKFLYVARTNSETALIIHSEDMNDVRFMFKEPSKEMIDAVTEYFNPQYIAVNQIRLPEGTEFTFNEGVMMALHPDTLIEYIGNNELTIDVEKVARIEDVKLASDYRKFARKHSNLELVKYDESHFEMIKVFLEEWSQARTEEQNKYAAIHNDLRFIELFGNDKEVYGQLVIDPEAKKIVGIGFFVPALDGGAIGVLQKNLRGYKQLGVFLAIERERAASKLKYKDMYIGPINNEFKKRFLPCAAKQRVYSRVIMCKPEFEVGIRYLLKIF